MWGLQVHMAGHRIETKELHFNGNSMHIRPRIYGICTYTTACFTLLPESESLIRKFKY